MKDENMAASAGHARRYLFVIKNVQFLYSHFWRIAEAIQAAGWEVWVVADCNVDPQRVLDAGMRIVPVPAPGGFWNVAGELRALYLRYRAMRRIRPDIAHFVTLKVALPCGILARLAGVPSVLIAVTGMGTAFTLDGPVYMAIRRAVLMGLKFVFGQRNAVLAVENSDDERYLIERGVVRADRSVVIPGAGIDISEITPTKWIGSTPIVLCAARLIYPKGIATLFDAARILKKRGIQFEVWLAGDIDPEYPLSLSLAEVKQAESDAPVRWLGRRSDMESLLQQCCICCLPTYREGLPRFLVEASAAGRPIVATRVPGCSDVVEEGRSGLLVPPRDPLALANSLERLILDSAERERLGEGARRVFEERFSSDHVLEAFDKCYKVLDQPLVLCSQGAAAVALEGVSEG
jgi:glycosyltransferase involved in cell wall biosynthesis